MTAQRGDLRFAPGRLWFGGDYNPEQWDASVLAQDIELMHRAQVTTATVGVFSWSRLEPEEGRYELGWLDDVMDTLHAAGIGVLLATPTASPPPWFSLAHPDALPVTQSGVRLVHGSRDTYCASAPAYRTAARTIARVLAERYGSHPALAGWHVHNEYGTVCWCDHVAVAFRAWLRRTYTSIEELDEAWYTAFWSQRYGSWEEVMPPRATQYLHNPAHVLDFRRFVSDELLACFTEQRDEIRAAGSQAPVTTNLMLPSWNHLEHWSWRPEMDLVAIDHYPDSEGPEAEAHVAYASDLARSWSHGDPWLLMEQSPTTTSLPDRIAHKDPDRMLRHSLAYVARGSQGALFFQWRASAAGAEAWHGALVPHAGPESRGFRAAVELGGVLAAISEVAEPPQDGPVVDADIAILWHAAGWWALDTRALPSEDLDYATAVRAAHRAAWRSGYAVDFASPEDDLSGYRVVLVPSMVPLSDAAVATLNAFVRGGGHLVVWYFSGITDTSLKVATGGYPGRLRDLLGVRVEELHPLDAAQRVRLSDGTEGATWSERMHLEGATALVGYVGGELDGLPAITRHPVDRGHATYVSTGLDDEATAALVHEVARAAGVHPVVDSPIPAGVEVIRRRALRGDYLFVLNHSASGVRVAGDGDDLVGARSARGGVEVGAGGYLVLREQPGARWSIAPTQPAPSVAE